MNAEIILDQITSFYLNSSDFNGYPFSRLIDESDLSVSDLHSIICNLVNNELITVIFGDIQSNPHIRAFADEPFPNQLLKPVVSGKN